MRIAIVYNGRARAVGGVPGHIGLLRRALAEQGCSVDVLSMEAVPPVRRYLTWAVQRSLNWLRPPLGHLVRCRASGPLFERVYKRRSAKMPYDGVIFETLWCCFTTECPSVCLLHALLSDNLQAYRVSPHAMDRVREFEARLLTTCPAPVVTTSAPYREWILQSLRTHLPLGWDKLGVVPLGVDAAAFVPSPKRPPPAAGLRLLYVGNLEARKNVPFLLEVARGVLLRRPNATLTLIGAGPEAQRAARGAAKLGIARQVRFLGLLAPSHVAVEMPKHHIFLLPSLKESFGHVLLEAKLAGLITLATAGLEVPPEFCDHALSLDVGTWVKQVDQVEAEWDSARDNHLNAALRQRYGPRRMAQDLLRQLER